jgi:DNA polymerase-3 subunit epsilon
MNRIVVLDTETTGLEVNQGHRLIEIGCIELGDRRRSGRHFQRYLSPERAVDRGALAVHGLDDAFLSTQPRFSEVAAELLQFIDGAELVIHNAAFDLGFLDAEMQRLDAAHVPLAQRFAVTDTLLLARARFPGQRNSLDALCKRFEIDNSSRKLHGALLDAELLTDVYLALTAGQSALSFAFDAETAHARTRATARAPAEHGMTQRPRVLRANIEEQAAHALRLDALDKAGKGACLWRQREADAGDAS